jgi:hypothetical protein
MRIRAARFVMIPMWVLEHADVRGNATRIAVYAGLRAVAWEAPDQEWRSTREIARAVSDVIGVGDEACRKHLTALKRIRALVKTEHEIIVPEDPPELGTAVGTEVPNTGSAGTQTDGPTTTEEREEDEPPVGTTGTSKADLNKEHPDFAEFWEQYPRSKDRPAAIRAFNKAMRAGVTLFEILDGLKKEKAGWRVARRPISKIPYPATWLNATGWLNEPDRPDSTTGATQQQRRARAEREQVSDIEQAIAEDRHQDAWAIVVAKASTVDGQEWWRTAEENLARGLPDATVAAVAGVEAPRVAELRQYRTAALSGHWANLRSLSQTVAQLTS